MCIFYVVIVVTIGYFGADVFCSDENLFLAISNPTAYCEIFGEFHKVCCMMKLFTTLCQWALSLLVIIRLYAGFTYQAGLLIFSGFWLLFLAHLFLKLVFPIQFHKFDTSRYRTKVHILEIVIVLLIGILIPAIVVGTVEYSIVNFPPTVCAANVEVTFYTLILPTILIQGTGIMFILFSFVSIHRVS